MLIAFTYGVPPHGGIAPGIDRLLFAILSELSLREVMAFPASASGQTSVVDAPSETTEAQLIELGITVTRRKATGDILMKIKQELADFQIPYQVYEHKPVFTSEEAAQVRGTSLHQGAKALVMFGDNKPLMVVVPADLKVDTKSLKTLYKIKDLRMATPEEVERVTGVKIGAVPPFGHLFKLSLYVDEKLRENEKVVFNAGVHTVSIELKEADYERLAHPTLGNFSKL